MAIATSRPSGRGTTRIAPSSNYSGTISRYADTIQSALKEERKNKISSMVLNWRDGSTTWNDLKTFLDKELASESPDSSLAIDLRELIGKLSEEKKTMDIRQRRAELTAQMSEGGITPMEKYDIEKELLGMETPGTQDYQTQEKNVVNAYANAVEYQVESKRSELLKQYQGGGITSEEELAINLELQKLAPEGTDTYNKLVQEEAQIRTNIQSEQEKAAKAGAGEATNQVGQLIEAAKQRDITLFGGSTPQGTIEGAFSQGQINGLQAEQESLKNWQEVLNAFQKAGIDQVEGIRVTTIQEIISRIQTSLDERQKGLRFDIIDDKGRQISASIDDVISGRVPATKNVRLNQQTGEYEVFDPVTGDVTFSSKDPAEADAKATEVSGLFKTRDMNGNEAYFSLDQNPKSDTYNKFIETKAGGGRAVYSSVPQTPEQSQKFLNYVEFDGKKVGNAGQIMEQTPTTNAGTALGNVFENIKKGVSTVTQTLTGQNQNQGQTKGPDLGQAALGSLGPIGAGFGLIKQLEPTVTQFTNRFQDIVSPVQTQVQNVARQASQTVNTISRSPLVQSFNSPQSKIGSIFGPAGSLIGAGLSRVTGGGGQTQQPNIIQKAGSAISSGINKVGSFLGGLFGK
jgi:hypothetical protein